MSLSKVLDETFQVWLNSYNGEISDDENASKIWAGFRYAIALANNKDDKKEKKQYEKAHGRYTKPKEEILELCRQRSEGTYLYYQGQVYPCIQDFDPEEWIDEEDGDVPLKTEEERISELFQDYESLSPKKKKFIRDFCECVPKKRVLYFGIRYRTNIWFTFEKECYGQNDGKYIECETYEKTYRIRTNSRRREKGETFSSAAKCFDAFC
ncbi:hypothetical protein GMAR_ORF82 [Golden Marseillevirus]|uniref:hypothetical protein n=1 Tax=Golden Marseillevirus TaxID=1720526 RepID=UPI000877AF3E|nr:hypothetical protein GMAR_ORF82 [Golden Marseillevirus]ALX27457.1 hypothetical protein GMAR_ORF82 [Golden Marseillevirus]